MFRDMRRSKQQLTEAECRELLSNEKIFGLDVTKTDLYPVVVADFARMVSGKGMVRATIHDVVNS